MASTNTNEPMLWEEHLADLYLLATDIVENHFAQRHGYKTSFYYAFNPNLSYRLIDGSYESQLKLLIQLQDDGLFTFEISLPPKDLPDDFFSISAQKFRFKKLLYVTLEPEVFNEKYPELKKYSPSTLYNREKVTGSLRTGGVRARINEAGDLSIDGAERLVHFKPQLNGYKLLRTILSNKNTRSKLWSYDELEALLDMPPNLREPADFIRNTANNAKRKIANTVGITDFLVVKESKEKAARTVSLNDRFV